MHTTRLSSSWLAVAARVTTLCLVVLCEKGAYFLPLAHLASRPIDDTGSRSSRFLCCRILNERIALNINDTEYLSQLMH
jgi:hypothetical protein